MHYQNAQIRLLAPGSRHTFRRRHPSTDALPSFPCPVNSMNAPAFIGQDQATNNSQNRATDHLTRRHIANLEKASPTQSRNTHTRIAP